jgi:hypothetical protein
MFSCKCWRAVSVQMFPRMTRCPHLHRACAGDRYHVRALREQPCKCDLARRGTVYGAECLERVRELEDVREVLL